MDEATIREAVRFLAAEHGLMVEPSGAIGVGAVLGGLVEPGNGDTVVVVTGRNVSARADGRHSLRWVMIARCRS